MKQLLLLCLSLLFVCLGGYSQDNIKCVVIETNSGESLEYHLSLKPRFIHDKDKVTLTTENSIIEFATKNLKKVYLAEGNYKIVYMLDGEVYKTYYHHPGVAISKETNPTKEGYTFSGWSNEPTVMPEHDVVVTGSFSVKTYKLTYMVDNEVYMSLDIESGSTIVPVPAPNKEGYTFSGWSDIPQNMPAEDVVVNAKFTPIIYYILYKVDGNAYKLYYKTYGSKIDLEPFPEKEGYAFSGWDYIPSLMPAYSVVVNGYFSVNQYTLTYYVNEEYYKEISMDYGSMVKPEEEPIKEGYTFLGWSWIPLTMPSYDVAVKGYFEVNTYTLTYKIDGEVFKSIKLEYGAAVPDEDTPIKDGYVFSGWSETPRTMPAHDVTIDGTFTIGQYTLSYVVDGENYKQLCIDYGATIEPEDEPTKEGYTFTGWSYIPEIMPAENVVVTGSYMLNTYQLIYEVDGEIYKTIDINYGSTIIIEAIPQKKGYSFSGWSEIPTIMPAHDVVVNGYFTIDKYTLTYVVDGYIYRESQLDYGSPIVPESAPVKDGYTFFGWDNIPQTMPAENIVVTGTLLPNKYKLIYKVNDEIYKMLELDYGSQIIAEPAPSREGYTFSGWSWIPSKMPSEDVVISGFYVPNKYTVTYMIDNAMYLSERIEFGAVILPPDVPERNGYVFAWGEIPETMPAHDVIVFGAYAQTLGVNSTSGHQGRVNTGQDYIYISCLLPDENVTIFNLTGEKQLSLQASKEGDLTISLAKLVKGVYIIKTNRQTFKITKR